MMRSMFSAISGLRNHQTYMDVVGNNIANVNTSGFRASRVAFQDVLSQTIRPATAPTATRGGVNALQIGLGVSLASVDTVQTQGALQSTGRLADLALEGDGYFVLADGTRNYYTRDGAFDRAIDGSLVSSASGLKVLGWPATNGVVDTTQPLGPIVIPLGEDLQAAVTASMRVTGNLAASAADGSEVVTDATAYDSLGEAHRLQVTFTKTGNLAWTWQVTSVEGLAVDPSGATAFTFDANGQVDPTTITPTPTVTITMTNGAADVSLALDLSRMTQLGDTSEVQATADGSGPGSLTTFSIDANGIVTGIYSNGVRETLGQIGVATFANSGGLVKTGGNLLDISPSSGQPEIRPPGVGARGTIAAGFLEMSNVDLAQQFTNMIMAERGFQANSRVVSTSNEILGDLVNLIR